MQQDSIEIFTDGSCHTQHNIGAWVAIILIAGEKNILSDTCSHTTHQQMELLAVIKALEHLQQLGIKKTIINLITDSQYVIGLPERAIQLTAKNFITNNGLAVANATLVKKLLHLLTLIPVSMTKIKAHQKQTSAINHNIEADKLSRHLVRQAVKSIE